MKTEELLLKFISSIVAAGIVVFITRTIQQRRWLNIVFFIVTLGSMLGLMSFPESPIRMETLLNFKDVLWVLLGLAIFVVAVLSWKDSIRRERKQLLGSFKSRNGVNPKCYELSIGSLPKLVFAGEYSPSKLTNLEANECLAKQITIYHLVDQADYVSWVDALYWATLRRLSQIGVSVKIYVFKRPYMNQAFLKYMKSISGPKVIIDEEVFDRLQIESHPPTSITDVKESNEKKTREHIDNGLMYTKLTAFARILPLLIGCRHIWILVWEDYYTKYFKNELNTLSQDVTIHTEILTKKENENIACLSLGGFETAFLVAPTAIGIDENGQHYQINPKNTFQLGESLTSDVYDTLRVLPNTSVKCIAREILRPLLPFAEALIFAFLFECIIIFRSDRVPNKKNRDQDVPTKLIAQLFCKTNHIVYSRIIRTNA